MGSQAGRKVQKQKEMNLFPPVVLSGFSPAIFLFRLLHSKSNSNSKASLIPSSELSILDIFVPDRGFGLKLR